MNLSELHAQVIVLFPGIKNRLKRTLIHALIDLGQITVFECMWEGCILLTVPLTPSGNRRKDSATIDHIDAIIDGGSDDWKNIQILHHTCNMHKGAKFTEDRRYAISQRSKQLWQDPAYHAKTSTAASAGNRTPEVSAKRTASMRRYWSDPERAAKHLEKFHRGDTHWTKQPGAKASIACDICGKICRGKSAITWHKTKAHK